MNAPSLHVRRSRIVSALSHYGAVLLALISNAHSLHAQSNHPADCWLLKKSNYGVSFTGVNPSLSQVKAQMASLATTYKVPIEVIAAICYQESGLYQYGNADSFLVHNVGECRYAYTNGVINSKNGVTPPGLGLMQLTSQTARDLSTGAGRPVSDLVTDWRWNLEAGVKLLVQKYNAAIAGDPTCLTTLRNNATNKTVLENWYYAIRYYYGANAVDSEYLDKIYSYIKTPPSRLSGFFPPVAITKPGLIIPNFTTTQGFCVDPAGKWTNYLCSAYIPGSSSVHVSSSFSAAGVAAAMVSPSPGSMLASSGVTFTWSAGTATAYRLYVGNSVGGSDIYSSGQISLLSATVNNLPTDGRTIYVRLSSLVSGSWQSLDYTYKAFTTVATETVSTPAIPTGTSSGTPNTSYTFYAGGASSSAGHLIQYEFDWGDGSPQNWLGLGGTGASHSWTGSGTYNVRVRARCTTHTSVVSAYSNALAVNIGSGSVSVTVTSPNGGEVWQAGSTHTITWNGNGTSSNMTYYKIALSTDGGVTWPAAQTANDLTPNGIYNPSARSFTWTLSTSLNTSQARIRVRAFDATSNVLNFDVSDSNFTISPVASLPNLTPYRPSAWSDAIVVSPVYGSTYYTSPLYATNYLYLVWAMANLGNQSVNSTFYINLYVDGYYWAGWSTTSLGANTWTGISQSPYGLGYLSRGYHSVQITVDPQNYVQETSDGDNSYTKTIYVN